MSTTAARPAARAAILGSFAYFARTDLDALMRRTAAAGVAVDFMADSGAFTAHTTGRVITVKQYAAWLALHAPHVNAAMTLDVIGDPDGTARNTHLLLDEVGDRVTIVPIFHIGSPWAELERWCEHHPYVALGGGVAVNVRKQQMMAWLVKAHKVAAACGAVLHGLGMTRPPYPDLLPFYSTDSSHWNVGCRSGTVTLFDTARGKFRCVRYSSWNSKERRRILTMPSGCSALIRAYGGDPEALATDGFGLASARGQEQGRADRDWMTRAAVDSWLAYIVHLRTRHRSVIAPPGVAGDGPKVYLAVGSANAWDVIVQAAADRAAAIPGGNP